MASHGFAQHTTEIRGERKVASFIKLRRVESRPASINVPAAHRSAENKHYVGMPVVGAASAILPGRAPKLRHGDHDCIFGEGTEVGPEGGDGLREFPQHVGELAFRGAFVDVMVPSSDIGEGDLYSEVRLDELRGLPQCVAESAARIVRSRRWRVALRIG